ncbi:tRNA (adenosine(37)-N6)-dimethylallyltransferase MiaA [Lactobacillus sp. DCY120]|uniref:tRNA dimethylallyltransferase n=1 Tax=Bombilactobacillus apium TaxID=2675299 RepID=A0A850RC95_9LACO|nr:tRNA (adenosine(37)-N6)-dimethylallyltransferase MiaA [Bombilactobacillus apium]NVY96926.1 tRNA (adenosine(37)-N6)-dimethylallyltransferase MiaA [Bombilactobacillus apium]
MKPKAIIILGPTAVGKTALGIELAQRFSGEIISGDSMQIYRHLDIGTAKATPAERKQIPHHLLDIQTIQADYSAYQFQQAAQRLIIRINQEKKLPIVVGGTGFYLKALIDHLNLGGEHSTDQNHQIRQQLERRLQQEGAQALWQELAAQDPEAAAKIPPQNTHRLLRALTVLQLTGQTFSQQLAPEQSLDCLILGLTADRKLLYQRIDQRVEQMVNQGLEQEARWLYERRQAAGSALQAIGYKEWFPYFDGSQTKARTVELIQRNSRRFAKRQLTYFRHQLTVHWFDLLEEPQQRCRLELMVQKFWQK